MPRKAATRFIAMPPSDPKPFISGAHGGPAWLLHAGEVAQWLVQLLGWLWLGQQGMLRGWSMAGGVMAVAVWWALRVACRGQNWALRCPSALVGALGGATALGVLFIESAPVSNAGPVSVVLLAAAWGVWCALIETRAKGGRALLGGWAWQPVVAAGLLGAALCLGMAAPKEIFALMLGGCAAVLYRRDLEPGLRARVCKSALGGWPNLLAPSSMGLMMGTMWLGGDWCMGTGWPQGYNVAAHVALMAGGPPVLAGLLAYFAQRGLVRAVEQHGAAAYDYASLLFTAAAAMLWLAGGNAHGGWAMALSSLAWALHCVRPRGAGAHLASHWGLWAKDLQLRTGPMRRGALLLGPVLLLWVGGASAQLGPQALQLALGLLGALAALLLLASGVQAARAYFHHQTV